jgi:HSP20 family protein
MSMMERLRRARRAPPATAAGHSLAALHRDVDWLFEELLGRMERPAPEWLRSPLPNVDVIESADSMCVTVDLPGMGAADVNVAVEDGVLVISGEKVEVHEEGAEERQWLMRERMRGAFRREIMLPSDTDVDAIDATFSQGVLTIVMPRRIDESSRPRTVEVQAMD